MGGQTVQRVAQWRCFKFLRKPFYFPNRFKA